MRKGIYLCILLIGLGSLEAAAQRNPVMTVLKENKATSVKDQARTGTCWSFSTTSLVESEDMRKGLGNYNLSEMFTVRKMYIEKAKNYLMRQGHAQFGQGGLGHDVIRAIGEYGAMPESAYTGLVKGTGQYDHTVLFNTLKSYLDSLLKHPPLPEHWLTGYKAILDRYMGKVPATFGFKGKTYTPRQFAEQVMHFNPDDYLGLTSFTHHPFNTSFIIDIPDNYANGYYYNVPLKELITLVSGAVKKGYTVMWDTDVSNAGWQSGQGYALALDSKPAGDTIDPDRTEHGYDQGYRQKLFDALITEDDHLMQITGISKDKKGKEFFIVKNSWGTDSGPFGGYVYVSVPYFAINTITVILPKAALDQSMVTSIAGSGPKFYQ
ncbi:MAG TPA: C1 family peptidase [Chitinophagaceae bacterium]|nr:C1 family peptidase [Chitinophagaceae bacterium]